MSGKLQRCQRSLTGQRGMAGPQCLSACVEGSEEVRWRSEGVNVCDRTAHQHQSRRQERKAQFKVCFRCLLGAESAGGWGWGW